MCGVPVHSAELYLHRLIRKGFKVAICEQLEDPAEARKRGGKSAGAPRRGPDRHPRHADRGRPARGPAQQLPGGAWRAAGGGSGLAWVDISTGAFADRGVRAATAWPALLARLEPGELLAPERLLGDPALRPTSASEGRAA